MAAKFIFAGADTAPEKTAVISNGRRLSYGQFARAIEAMVQRLETVGVGGAGYAVVAIGDLLEHWIISFALRELGLTTLPIRETSSAEQLTLSQVRYVIMGAQEEWPGLVELSRKRGWTFLRARSGGAMARPIEVGRKRADLVGEHVLQTSATTGTYKLVLEGRDKESVVMAYVQRAYSLDADSKVAHFDLGTWTAVGHRMTSAVWFSGGAVLLQQGQDLHRPLETPGLTHGLLMPSLASALLRAGDVAFPYQPDMVLRMGGTTPSRELVDWVRQRITQKVHNTFGSTEAPTLADTLIEADADRRWHRPVADRGVEVVDDADQLVAIGETGRLRVSTRYGPDGYLENPEATAHFFRQGYFYTGDLAIQRDDGRFTLVGRMSDVINVMGHKQSPEPLEERLREMLGVSAACVVSLLDKAGDEKIHAVLETPRPLPLERVTPVLSEIFAGTGMPTAHVHFLPELPRNAIGKVLREELRRRVARMSV